MDEKVSKEDDIIIDLGRLAVKTYYEYQAMRIALYNRIRDVVRRKVEGIPVEKPEGKKEEKKFLKEYTDKNLPKYLKKLSDEKKIQENEYKYLIKLIDTIKETYKTEKKYKALMKDYLKNEEIWSVWLKKIRGIGDVLGSNIVKNFGYCEHSPHVSSLYKYCGMDPDSAKGRKKGKKIGYNPRLKTLCYKISSSFINQRTPVYRWEYDKEKNRQVALMGDSGNPHAPKSLLHCELRARRKMVKIFLQHYWVIARRLKGLPVSKPYQFDKLGHTSYIEPPFNPFKNKDNQKMRENQVDRVNIKLDETHSEKRGKNKKNEK